MPWHGADVGMTLVKRGQKVGTLLKICHSGRPSISLMSRKWNYPKILRPRLPSMFVLILIERGGSKCWRHKSNDFSSICTGSDNLFIGSNDGNVRILSQSFKVLRTFKAHDVGSIMHLKQVEGTALLVTIAEDLSSEPTLKVWALDQAEKKNGGPKCLSTLSIHNGRKQFPVWM